MSDKIMEILNTPRIEVYQVIFPDGKKVDFEIQFENQTQLAELFLQTPSVSSKFEEITGKPFDSNTVDDLIKQGYQLLYLHTKITGEN